jgi:hypothetical protein
MFDTIPDCFLNGSTIDFIRSRDSDLLRRWHDHAEWCDGRLAYGVESYAKYTASEISCETEAGLRNGVPIQGVNCHSACNFDPLGGVIGVQN